MIRPINNNRVKIMGCEYLFCYEKAVSRVTVPTVKPGAAMCDKHTAELLKTAERYRRVPGMVQIARP